MENNKFNKFEPSSLKDGDIFVFKLPIALKQHLHAIHNSEEAGDAIEIGQIEFEQPRE